MRNIKQKWYEFNSSLSPCVHVSVHPDQCVAHNRTRPGQFYYSYEAMSVFLFFLVHGCGHGEFFVNNIYIYIYDYKPLNLSVKYNQSIHNKNSSYFHGKCHRPTVFVINILHVLFASYIHVHTEVGTVY